MKKIKILSWNIWCGTYLNEVIKFLQKNKVDIISFQEVIENNSGNIAKMIAEKLGYEYVYAIDMDMPLKWLPGYEKDNKKTIKMGNAILSRYKIVESKVHKLIKNEQRSVIEANIYIGDVLLNVFSVHIMHTHQKQLDLQDLQIENLLKILPEKNTIVMGDFNSLPNSSVIQRMNKSLNNSEINCNTPTWSVYKDGCDICKVDKVICKLDYIFTSKDIVTNSFRVYSSKASDHLPVSTFLELK
jgi:endonuclease/exonuclease/phosphatase family metal-dependent hydrolase